MSPLSTKNKIEEAVEWYDANYSLCRRLAARVKNITEEILKQNKINYHSITFRAKSVERYREKASKEKYKDPRSEITDMAGIRVITYLDSEAKEVERIIRSTFDIIPELSKDKTQELGTDRVGYRSIHCVGNLGKERLALPENQKFSGLVFEVQIRTLLQHAWAEFEHDRNYKFKGVLPDDIKRRFALLAGNLEFIDQAFESISVSIDDYTREVEKKTAEGDLSTEITSASLKVYLDKKLGKLVPRSSEQFIHTNTIEELSIMGIKTLEELDKAIPKDFVERNVQFCSFETYGAFLINVMIIRDAKTYFEKAWRGGWNVLSPQEFDLLKHYGVPIGDYVREFGFGVIDTREFAQDIPEEPEWVEPEPDEEPSEPSDGS
jgi:ppGpp synthetase/RelA/SpoT-type nucleotidyltranferase